MKNLPHLLPVRRAARAALAIVTASLAGAAVAGGPHQHGVARLDLAVDGPRIVIDVESPLDNLVGFERAPRTAAERQRTDAMAARLKRGETLFMIDAAAGCRFVKAELVSAVLKLGPSAPPDAQGHAHGDEHADLEAHYEFECDDSARAAFLETALFEGFPRLRRIDVQGVASKGQFKATLKRPTRRIALVR